MSYEAVKRLLDISGAVIGIIIFAPVMLLTSLYIKIISPTGPVLADTPKRVGKGGTEFKMYKFRSMIPNAHTYLIDHPELYEKYKANNFKLDPDPRWLPGGRFIRKYSIDELPQFFNVLLGDMSLIGPRAYYPYELEEQGKLHPQALGFIKEAITIKPGITGPWQVGGRSALSFVERIRIDAQYAKNSSILYDLMILLKTPFAVLRGRGAY